MEHTMEGLSQVEKAGGECIAYLATLPGVDPAEKSGLLGFASAPSEFTPATVGSVVQALAVQIEPSSRPLLIASVSSYLALALQEGRHDPMPYTLALTGICAMSLGVLFELADAQNQLDSILTSSQDETQDETQDKQDDNNDNNPTMLLADVLGQLIIVLHSIVSSSSSSADDDDDDDDVDGGEPGVIALARDYNLVDQFENGVHCAVAAMVSRSGPLRAALASNAEVMDAATGLRQASIFTHAAVKMLAPDERILVLHPASRSGWEVVLAGISTMDEAYVLLHDTLVGHDGSGLEDVSLGSMALFTHFALTSTTQSPSLPDDRLTSLGLLSSSHSTPGDIPVWGQTGMRTLLLRTDLCANAYNHGANFPWLTPSGSVARTLLATEVDALLDSITSIRLEDRIAGIREWCTTSGIHPEWAYASARLVLDHAQEDENPSLFTPLLTALRPIRDEILSPASSVVPSPACPSCIHHDRIDASPVIAASPAVHRLMNMFRDSVYHALASGDASFSFLDAICAGSGPRGFTNSCLLCSRTLVSPDSDSDA